MRALRRRRSPPRAGYDAFISYSHGADAGYANSFQRALQQFAKPFYRLRAMRVFRDETSLAADPRLWSALQAHLDASRYLILLASPQAAGSPWVDREVARWLQTKSPDRLLFVLTDGEISWGDGDFDWARTTALPPALRGRLAEEPLYHDVRWAGNRAVPMRDARLSRVVARLAATIRGRDVDELIGEDVRQHRRLVRAVVAVTALIAALAVLAGVLGLVARAQRDLAREEAAIALSRHLASQSSVALGRDALDEALLLAAASFESRDTVQARDALATAIAESGRLVAHVCCPPGERPAASSVAFAPHGRTLAVARRDGTVALFDLATRSRSAALLGEPGEGALSVAFRADGRVLAVGRADGRVELFTLAGRRRAVRTFSDHRGAVTGVAFLRGGLLVSAGRDGRVVLRQGRRVQRLPLGSAVRSLAVAGDGRLVAAGGAEGRLAVWDRRRSALLAAPRVPPDTAVTALAYDDDGALVVGRDDGALIRWDAGRRSARVLIGPGGQSVESVDVRGEGDLVAAGAVDGTVRLLRPPPRRSSELLARRRLPVNSVAFSPAGELLASAAEDGSVLLWRVAGPAARERVADVGRSVTSLAFAGNGRTLAAGVDDGIVVLGDRPPRRVRRAPADARVAYAPDGTLVGVGTESGVVVRAPNGRRGSSYRLPGGPFTALAVSSGGEYAAATAAGGGLAVWSLDHGPPRRVGAARTADAAALAIGSSSGEVAVAEFGGGVRVLSGTPLQADGRLATDEVFSSLAIDAEGDVVAAGATGRAQLWRVGRQAAYARFPVGRGSVEAIALSPAGDVVAAASLVGGAVVADARLGRPLGRPISAAGAVGALAFSPDGSRLAVGTIGGEVAVWASSPAAWHALACRIANRALTRREWIERVGGEVSFRPPCRT